MSKKDPTKVPSPKGVVDPDAFARQQNDIEKEGGLERRVSEHDLRQPNERDEAPDGGARGTDRATDMPQTDIPRAHDDIERGLRDTERRGIPSNVPSSAENEGEKTGQSTTQTPTEAVELRTQKPK